MQDRTAKDAPELVQARDQTESGTFENISGEVYESAPTGHLKTACFQNWLARSMRPHLPLKRPVWLRI